MVSSRGCIAKAKSELVSEEARSGKMSHLNMINDTLNPGLCKNVGVDTDVLQPTFLQLGHGIHREDSGEATRKNGLCERADMGSHLHQCEMCSCCNTWAAL